MEKYQKTPLERLEYKVANSNWKKQVLKENPELANQGLGASRIWNKIAKRLTFED